MKKLLLSCIAAASILFISCSNDDSKSGNKRILSHKTERFYFHNSETNIFVANKNITDYNNDGLPVKRTFYSGEDTLIVIYEYTYDNQGFLKKQLQHGEQNTGSKYIYEFSYDASGRLTEVHETLSNVNTDEIYSENITTYTYGNNSIVKTSDKPGADTPVEYILNSGDAISMIVDNNNNKSTVVTYTYSGYNIKSTSRTSDDAPQSTVNYIYEDMYNPDFLVFKPYGGSFFANKILLSAYVQITDATELYAYDRYIQSVNYGEGDYTVDYEFNDQNLPTKKIVNGSNRHLETTYTYK